MIKASKLLLKASFNSTVSICKTLFKLMIPISLLVKGLQLLHIVDYLGSLLAPVMHWVHLPGTMALVWATAMMGNIYSSMVVYSNLATEVSLSQAQITVLASLILLAHTLPLELSIAKKSGVSFTVAAVFRIGGSFVLAMILAQIFSTFQLLQSPAHCHWTHLSHSPTIGEWLSKEVFNYCKIVLIIFCLVTLIKIFEHLNLMPKIQAILSPFLGKLGIGPQASPLVVIGMMLGMAYGGGLIIQESQKLSKKDVFCAMVFVGLCHSLIEDPIILSLLGAHYGWLLLPRLFFAPLVTIAASFGYSKLTRP